MDVLLLGHVNVLFTALLLCFSLDSIFTIEATTVPARGVMA